MLSTYVGKAAATEYKPVRMLKSGGLPKRIQTALDGRGYDFPEGKVFRDGKPVRPRIRHLEFNNVQTKVLHELDLGNEEKLAITHDWTPWIGKDTLPTGFWQYMKRDDNIYSSYNLHTTVTGRSASRDPNNQNYPKRGKLAKAFRKIFVPRDGFTFLQGDLSQAELRVAAIMAREDTMLRIYREGGDIHTYTAAAIIGINPKTFAAMEGSTKEVPASLYDPGMTGNTYGDYFTFKRYQAKAMLQVSQPSSTRRCGLRDVATHAFTR